MIKIIAILSVFIFTVYQMSWTISDDHGHQHKKLIAFEAPRYISSSSPKLSEFITKCESILANEPHLSFATALDFCEPYQYACVRTISGVWHFTNPQVYTSECTFSSLSGLCNYESVNESSRICLHDYEIQMNNVVRQRYILATTTNAKTGLEEKVYLRHADAVSFQRVFELLHDNKWPCNTGWIYRPWLNDSYC
jgi:hypothetical protein